MKKNQNIYDNDMFFEGYKKLRQNPDNANILEEKPAIMNLCPDLSHKNVLDLGCGFGENCRRFSEMGATIVIGIDISQKMLEIANRENKTDNIEYYNIDMMSIDTLNEKFDVVFSSLAVHYIEDFKALISKISNLLKNNGVFIFSQEHPLTTAPIKGASWTKDENGNIVHYNLSDYCRNGERGVEHVGSTAIEGLASKPIIDYIVIIDSYEVFPLIVKRLEFIGFEHEGDLGVKGREAFRRTFIDKFIPYHIYICPQNSTELRRQIAFRDYLKAHEEDMHAYAMLKMQLAEKHKYDIDGYVKGKHHFVENILKKSEMEQPL